MTFIPVYTLYRYKLPERKGKDKSMYATASEIFHCVQNLDEVPIPVGLNFWKLDFALDDF